MFRGRQYRSIRSLNAQLRKLIRTRLWFQVLVGMALGITVGICLSPSGLSLVSERTANLLAGWLVIPGQIFLALIQMVVIPLVFVSIVLGIVSSDDPVYLRKLGFRIGPYFVFTTVVAVFLGIAVAMVLKPGDYVDSELLRATLGTARPTPVEPVSAAEPGPTVPERIVRLVPSDPMSAALDRSMFEIVVFAILIGIALVGISKERARLLVDLFGSIRELTMEVVSWAMFLAPFAVFGLLAQITIKVGLEAFLGMSVYVGSVLLGLLLVLVFYGLVVWVLGGKAPWKFYAAIRGTQLLAFSTSSSAAVMPLSIKTAEDALGVRESIAKFVVPLGATINMDGTAIYQVIAAVFLTQVFGVELTMAGLLLLIGTTVGASIGAPSSPGVGIVILATILQGIGIPPSGIALIIGVDRILDMSRTTVNVTGDLAACVVMERWLRKEGTEAEETSPEPTPTAA